MFTIMGTRYTVDLYEVGLSDAELVGGKNASIGELLKIGVNAPIGFAITVEGYKKFFETGLKAKIAEILDSMDVEDTDSVQKASARIRNLVEEAAYPFDLEQEIRLAYRRLAQKLGKEAPEVAVRSSATIEDLPDASFAGQQDTYLFVSGEDDVLKFVKKCFGSVFTPRAMVYRNKKGFDHLAVKLSVGVMQMINSKASGVCFTLDPVSGDDSVIVIEGSWGIGEAVVQGRVMPDRFVVEKSTLKIRDKQISDKALMTVRDPAAKFGTYSKEVQVPEELRRAQCISDEQILELARVALKIESHYKKPVDIEWALDGDTGKIFVVQARPETVWTPKRKVEAVKNNVLVKGLGASPGRASGQVQVILDVKDIASFKKGGVLVTKMTTPDWLPAMSKAAAIVTDSGGMTAHAAIVSRELGIPCVVGTGNATSVLRNGQVVTVDGSLGVVIEGELKEKEKEKEEKVAVAEYIPPTATKVYMNLGEPAKIEEYKDLPFDGIGLMRVEFILADWIGQHPLDLIEKGGEEIFVAKLAEGIAKVAQAIYPRPVVVRFSDFKTNEYRSLKGGERFEPEESNPMLGWRGVSRYISKNYEPAFRLECRAIKRVREEMGLKNVWVMFPFARTTWEVEKALKIMKEEGLERGRDFKVWIMAEVPSVVLLAEEFSKLCDGFSIGSNDLTQLVLGADRDSAVLASLGYFDERDPAVKKAMQILIEKAHENGVSVSICGQAPSVYPELTEFLVRVGIDSVSVNPDVVKATKKLIASIEQKLILEGLRVLSKRSKLVNE
ncbi:phosphoenolpyruvate synthase [Candidatus Marsarchaeota G1 archaeon OSP_B]|jgi:phosphoenolpyruvate synthase (EC 2.7.9.2)|uniref:Phosphoenolpyruvate synthase n=3 Tax=Candidatus Marsarchaeota group 1 TaxID=2203770 RepID=A0A2R6ABB6_9ARCH|nr:MAG: phosphoenolpyruvate synthase [Candidatus Marsarchaeota G1 archaeon OSP_D]PSN88381.1 MAG: phosphoenolpyruvate synthase [Candidatus Marsarchaeota G1 archaeon OSP_C]PSN95891.1 MAG: phosphoenolpyruvate synthase [Candidatus Marsarchaeota G1 archaeon OSP_B]